MSTTVRTAKSVYTVESIAVPVDGPARITVRQPSGKVKHLTVKEVGRTRFDAAVAHFLAERSSSVPV